MRHLGRRWGRTLPPSDFTAPRVPTAVATCSFPLPARVTAPHSAPPEEPGAILRSGGGICPEALGTSPEEDLAPSPTSLLSRGWFRGYHFLALSTLDNKTVSPQCSWGTQEPAPAHWGTQMTGPQLLLLLEAGAHPQSL